MKDADYEEFMEWVRECRDAIEPGTMHGTIYGQDLRKWFSPSPPCPRCERTLSRYGRPLAPVPRLAKGVALAPTLVMGAPDFPGATVDSPGQTVSRGGPGRLVEVLKCPACGYSRRPTL